MSESTATLTLPDFLLARIAEDEAMAVNANVENAAWWVDGPAKHSGRWWVYATGEKFASREVAEHIAHHDPARVLRECKAKRRIVERLGFIESVGPAVDHTRALDMQTGSVASLRDAVTFLAAVYADHPDYRDEWRP